jgi:hypothetical protein
MPVVLDTPMTMTHTHGSTPGRTSSSSWLTTSDGFHDPGLAFGQKGEDKDDNGDDLQGRDEGKGSMTRRDKDEGMTTTTTSTAAMGGVTQKNNETKPDISLVPPHGPMLANIVCKGRDAAWKLSSCRKQ